jgi:hypothetical protein
LLIAIAAILLTAANRFNDWDYRLKSEYSAAGVISEVTRFVESHNGQWPTGWRDIPNGTDASRYVTMKFDVVTDELIANPSLIYDTIRPKSGEYRTYPHAERQLDALRESLIRFHVSADKKTKPH